MPGSFFRRCGPAGSLRLAREGELVQQAFAYCSVLVCTKPTPPLQDLDCGRTGERRADGEDCTGRNEGERPAANKHENSEGREAWTEGEVHKVAIRVKWTRD